MIVNLERFVAEERSRWERLDAILDHLARDPYRQLPLDEARELERLYQRAAADLARLASFAAEPAARHYLEGLVARAHAEIHGMQAERTRFRPVRWFTRTLPQAWRRHATLFWFAAALMMTGSVFGGAALALDPESKSALMPFSNLQISPAERVAEEEQVQGRGIAGRTARFSGALITNNTKVTLFAAALGMSWGVGTLVLLFYNGVGLGAVAVDYVLGGQTRFLLGWLLPHGVVEIPAILVGAQAGFVLAGALLGRGRRENLRMRLRMAVPDVVTLIFGAAVMLVWAGLVEAFLSQYHEPLIPYELKIMFGVAELAALTWFLSRAGRKAEEVR